MKGPPGAKYCDTRMTTGYCCVRGPAPIGCPGYLPAAASTTEYPMAPCGIYGPPGTKTCGATCVEECIEYHPTTEDPTFHSPTEYPMPPMDPTTETPTYSTGAPLAPTDHYFFHRGFGQGSPVMAVYMNKKAGCRCANMMATPFPKVASICHTGCGIKGDTQLCATMAPKDAFGPGKNGMKRPHCSGACKPDTSKMSQPNGNQHNGVTKLTFEDCSNQCEEMGPNWSMIDSGSRHLAEGSGCGFDYENVWSKNM